MPTRVASANVRVTLDHLQYGGGYRTDKAHRARVRRHKREVRKLGRVARRRARKGKVFVVLDGNFDGLKVRGLTSCWTGPDLPSAGTLGKRRVDIIFAASAPKRVRTVKTPSDHRAVVADY